jgi:hypothetical protein
MSSAVQAEIFPVLAEPATLDDGTLQGPATQLAEAAAREGEIEAEPQDVRAVGVTGTDTVGIMPTHTGTCILVADQNGVVAGACSPAATVGNDGIMMGFEDAEGHHVVGVLPSGARGVRMQGGDGTETSLALTSANAYSYVGAEPPRELAFTGAEGHGVHLSLPGPVSAKVAK